MSTQKGSFLGSMQKLGKAMMTPVAVLPAASLLLRFGQSDLLNLPWMAAAGNAIFANLALIFAIGIAIGLAEDNNGVAGLAALVGYEVLTSVAVTFNKDINMGALAGILIGILSGYLYNKYKGTRLPDFLGFFGGRRFVPILTSFVALVLGVIAGYVWPAIQNGINAFGTAVAGAGAFGAFIFGFLNRILLPFGLHHVVNTLFWFQFGSFTHNGKIFTGDLTRFFNGDPTAGTYMTGFFPIMMFALPAAALAMITTAKKANKKAVTGMLISLALTSFLTGITEPIEFSFMFLAPGLYLIHAVLTGVSLAVTSLLGIKDGFGFSAGLTDYLLNFNIAKHPIELVLVGLVFAVIYYFLFVFVITKFDLKTPGRTDDEESSTLLGLSATELVSKASQILEAIGAKGNIDNIDACITRIRVTLKDGSALDEEKLKAIGATAVMKMGARNFQIVVGTVADPLVNEIKGLMKK